MARKGLHTFAETLAGVVIVGTVVVAVLLILSMGLVAAFHGNFGTR